MRIGLCFPLLLIIMIPAASAQCAVPADLEPCDGNVSIAELTGYIDLWYSCSACAPGLLEAITAYYSYVCMPDCASKTCGDDACGGSCPPGCGEGYACSTNYTCVWAQEGLVNIARLATVTSRPYGDNLGRAIDGYNGSGVGVQNNLYIYDRTYEFRFSGAQPVSRIRFILPPNWYSIWVDTTGNGTFDTELASVSEGPTSRLWGVPEWVYGEWAGEVDAYAVRLYEPSIRRFGIAGHNGTPPQIGEKVYQWDTSGVRQHRSGTMVAENGTHVWVRESNGEGWNWGSSGWLERTNANPGARWSDANPEARWVYSTGPMDASPDRFLYEFEILADEENLSRSTLDSLAALDNPPLDPGIPAAASGGKVQVGAPPVERQYFKIVSTEGAWEFGAQSWTVGPVDPRLDPTYQWSVRDLHALGANAVWLFPVTVSGSASDYLLFPSQFEARDMRRLRKVTTAAGAMPSGLTVGDTVQNRASNQTASGWIVRVEQQQSGSREGIYWIASNDNDFVWGTNGSVIFRTGDGASTGLCTGDARDGATNHLASLAAALGSDGIRMQAGHYGFSYSPHPKANYTADQVKAGTDAEMALSGVWSVDPAGDEFYYDPDGSKVRSWVSSIKAASSSVLTLTNLMVMLDFGHDFQDIIGHEADVDYLSSSGSSTMEDPYGHWFPATKTAMMAGANPNGSTCSLISGPWAPGGTRDVYGHDNAVGPGSNPLFYETFPPVMVYGAMLSAAFHGAEGITYYRLHDMGFYNGYNVHAATGFSMLDTLAAWGGREAVVPDDILVLVNSQGARYFPSFDYSYNILGNFPDGSNAGSYSIASVTEALLEAGLPYRIGYMNYTGDFDDLGGTKVIIVPFAGQSPWRAMDGTAAAFLQEQADAGKRIIIMNRIARSDCLLPNYTLLASHPNVTVLADDMSHGLTPQIRQHILSPVLSALGSGRPAYLNAYGRDIELASMENGDAGRLLLVTNWENRSVTADIGIKVPAGDYQMLRRDLNETRNISISGSYTLTEQDLARFRVNLDAGGSLIFYIYPA